MPGLELYDNDEAVGAVGALKAGAGPLNVYANYHGQESNRVTFKSVDADPNVKLEIDVDRTLRIAGEQGRVVLTASGPGGDVELVPSLTKFKSSDDKVLKMIAGKTGLFATGIAGNAVADRQPSGGQGAGQEGVPRLRSGQGEAGLRSGQRSRAGQSEGGAAALAGGNGGRREEGKTAGRVAGAGRRLLRREARGRAVLSADPHRPAARRRPSTSAVRSPCSGRRRPRSRSSMPNRRPCGSRRRPPRRWPRGSTVALTVEQQVGDSDAWQEVRPDAVNWTVPPQSIFGRRPRKTCGRRSRCLPDLQGRSEARRLGGRQDGLGGLHA